MEIVLNMPEFFKHLLFGCFVTLITTIFAIRLLQPFAQHIGLVDAPDARKLHKGKIPIVGGVAILFGLSIGLLTLDFSLASYRALIASAGILVFLGVLDDFHEISPHTRLFAQLFVGFLIAFVGKNAVINLGNLLFFGPITLGIVAIPFTMIAIMGVINAINMMDGVDGLAGSVVLIQFCLLSFLAFKSLHLFDYMFLWLIIMAVIAFLLFNFPLRKRSAVIFMGDTGTMLLGVLLSWFLISLSQGDQPAAHPVTFLWIIAMPLYDMVYVVCRRIATGCSPFRPDRGHFHHLLQRVGLSDVLIVLVISLLSLLLGAIGISADLFWHISEPWLFVGFLGGFVIYVLSMRFVLTLI